MRSLWAVAALLILSFSGCIANDPVSESEPTPSVQVPVISPQKVTAKTPVLPAEFLAGPLEVALSATGFPGAEPNIGITSEGNVFVSAYENILVSRDTGATWDVSYTQVVGFTADPMLWVDPITDRVFSPQMFPVLTCSNLIFSDDEGATWIETQMACGTPVVDHQKLATGPYAEPFGALEQNPVYPNSVSYCYNKLAGTHCAISYNGGLTYEQEVLVDTSPLAGQVETDGTSCGGLNGHQHHAADGTIYVPLGFNCGEAHIGVSTDNGLTYRVEPLVQPIYTLDPEVTSTPDGMVYYFFQSQDVDTGDYGMYLLRSSDQFVTYEGPFRVSPPEVRANMFAGMTSGSDGRLAFSWLGTDDYNGLADDAPSDAEWHLYVAMTVDATADDPTFVTIQVTPDNDPVQRGSLCQHKQCQDGNRNLLDFIDMHAGPDGRYWVAFADGCTGDCLESGAGPSSSRDDELVVAYLAAGPSLLEDVGRI